MEELENKSQDEVKVEDDSSSTEVTLEDLKYKSWKDRIIAGINGILVGLAVIVPGVAGSTISMMFKLYDKMMLAISKIFKKFKIAFLFLIPILIGAVIGFVGGFFAVQSVIESYTFICVSLFGGLMLGGTFEVSSEIKLNKSKDGKRKPLDWILLVIGFIFPIAMAVMFYYLQDVASLKDAFEAESFPVYLYFIALALGVVVSLTQIIPGLSATAILMCFGAFTPIMNSVHIHVWQENPMWFVIYILLAVGFVFGIVLFSKLVTYLLKKFRFTTFHLLTGLSFGSVIAMFCNSEIMVVYENYLQGLGNIGLDLGLGIPLFIVGFIASFALVRYGQKKEDKAKSLSKE